MSTPAASARLKKVHQALGVSLFSRTAQGLIPTADGHVFIRHARLVLNETDALNHAFETRKIIANGCIRLFANTLAMAEFVPAALERFLLQYPSVSIDIHERGSADIAKALRSGTADVGILSNDFADEGFYSAPYRTENLVLVTGRDHPLASGGTVKFAQTLGSDYVGLGEHDSLQAFITNAASSEGILMRLRIQAKNFEALCTLVESGVGVGVVPETVARRHASQLQIEVVPLSDAWAVRELKIAVRDPKTSTLAVKALVDVLVAPSKPCRSTRSW